MKLIDFLEVYDENNDIVVEDTDGNILATYDGRDSIPESYNDSEIINIYPVTKVGAVVKALVRVTIAE